MKPADLRLEIRFKNAVLYEAIHAAWAHIAAARQKGPMLPIMQVASEMSGVGKQAIYNLLALKETPFSNRDGSFRPAALALANALQTDPEVLFPKHLYSVQFPSCLVKHVESSEFLPLSAAKHLQIEPPQYDEVKERITEAIKTLDDVRLRKVLTLRFGLDGEGERSLDEIAEQFHVTRERVRQIEARAIRKLSEPSRIRKLRGLL